ncbi:hypothetical protein [Streptomyces sp. NPDC056160]|uniref:hypothetical protein n=1 Tax=Streptomyces sp. NPDC056160 TaxID=3345731 RepID=UPI0035DA0E0B
MPQNVREWPPPEHLRWKVLDIVEDEARAEADRAAGRRGANGRPPVSMEHKTVLVRQRARLVKARARLERVRPPSLSRLRRRAPDGLRIRLRQAYASTARTAAPSLTRWAHQWWYGIVGNDEYGASWLDESFAQYANARFYGRDTRDCWSDVDWPSEQAAITNSRAYWSSHRGDYHLVDTAGPCALSDLECTIEADTMARLLKRYAHDHWYGVSATADFKKAAQSVTDHGLDAFWAKHCNR